MSRRKFQGYYSQFAERKRAEERSFRKHQAWLFREMNKVKTPAKDKDK